jgi:hypothetical protein
LNVLIQSLKTKGGFLVREIFKIKCKFAIVVYLGNDEVVDLRNIVAPKVKFHNKTNHSVTVYFHEDTIIRPIWHD